MRQSLDGDRLADNARIASEPASPETMAEDHDLADARSILATRERAAVDRLYPEHAEEIARRQDRADADRTATAGERPRVVVIHRERLQAVLAIAIVEELRGSERVGAELTVLETNQAVGLRERQRAEDHAVDDREHRRGRSNPEGHRHDCRGRESRLPAQHASPVAQVLSEARHPASPRRPCLRILRKGACRPGAGLLGQDGTAIR